MENLKLKRAITDSSLESGPMRGGNFHECFISFAAECLDNISFMQSSDTHNSEVEVNLT
jgi:hypothetical protein